MQGQLVCVTDCQRVKDVIRQYTIAMNMTYMNMIGHQKHLHGGTSKYEEDIYIYIYTNICRNVDDVCMHKRKSQALTNGIVM